MPQVSNRLFLSLECTLRYRAALPDPARGVAGWRDAERLPPACQLDGGRAFADAWGCWSEEGLAFAFRISGRSTPVVADERDPEGSDGVQLLTDMRDARSNRRATRFCQRFYFLPRGSAADPNRPCAGVLRVAMARAEKPAATGGQLICGAAHRKDGYDLFVTLSRAALAGYDPVEHPRIGFTYMVTDRELGRQGFSAGTDAAWNADPSLWATLVLAR